MSISVKNQTFTLSTNRTAYQMKVGAYNFLFHTYYGKKIDETDMSYLFSYQDVGFFFFFYDAGKDRTFSIDTLPLEYSSFGIGDFRGDCIQAELADGSSSIDFRYRSHKIYAGKYGLTDLPATYGEESEWATLEMHLFDIKEEIELILYYGVMEKWDIITRACRLVNHTDNTVKLHRMLSACLDLPSGNYDMVTFYGRHARERNLERARLHHGIQGMESIRGASSHQYNPFVILCEPHADEEKGECYGMSFVYSGNFLAQAEVTQRNTSRLVMGIHPTRFLFTLEKGESFTAPEVILTYSAKGFHRLSSNYHKAVRNNLCRGKYKTARRPVLINNWEGTYFDFTDSLLLQIAEESAKLGIEMFVLDDGWFGKRNDDFSGLGDWYVNESKLRCGLKAFSEKIHDLGMQFGIWFEPEMVSEDSDLFRTHPDYVLNVPGRPGCRGRYQFVLDFSRKEVRDLVYEQMRKILDGARIDYIKWDMNRHLTNVWSAGLPAERQGEVYHRYVLGLYEFLERLHRDYPDLLLEGCCGGGGRFDAGMLYYTPQIWCSDNTDARERLFIQYGTSFGYPVSAVGSHVSASPNHQTGRECSLAARGAVAMAGTFGYELNVNQMTEEEKETVKKQITDYKRFYDLIQDGEYYRLSGPYGNTASGDTEGVCAWEFVSEDRTRALLFAVLTESQGNPVQKILKLRGLNPEAVYTRADSKEFYTGTALMNGGILLPCAGGYCPAVCMEFTVRKE